MKKTALIVALAAIMVFAFANSAFASWGGWAGNGPYTPTPGSNRPSSSYLLWNDVVDPGTDNTPHKGYTTSSTLCAVCHSVHYAPVFEGQIDPSSTTGAWTPSTNAATTAADYITAESGNYPAQAQLLLRGKAGTACNYCHVDSAVGNVVVYAGQADIFGYSQNFESSYAHNYHNAGCGDCHSVHGAKTYDGPLASAILHQQPRNRNPQPEIIDASAASNESATPIFATLADAYAGTDIAATGDRFVQQTAFCSSCHYVYNTSSGQAIKDRDGGFAKHHPMADAPTTHLQADWRAKGANDEAGREQWAWDGSNTCRTCHSAGNDGTFTGDKTLTAYSESSFPHYTKDKYRFLDQTSPAEYATDEVCLNCHRSTDDTAGVGKTF